GLKPDDIRNELRNQAQTRMAAAQGGGAGVPADPAAAGGATSGRGTAMAQPGGSGAADTTRGGWRRGRGDSTTAGGGGRRWGGGGRGGLGRRDSAFARGGGGGGNGGGGGGFGGGAGGVGGGRGRQMRVAFVKQGDKYVPRVVRIGVSNYDYAQVLSGLQEGEQVALLSAATLQLQREQSMQNIRQRMGEILAVALAALRANKLRSFLTMLGVVIGVAAVIAMVALGRGAQASVKARIASLGTTLLTVMPTSAR